MKCHAREAGALKTYCGHDWKCTRKRLPLMLTGIKTLITCKTCRRLAK